ncbi:MAG: site-2 protease family protein [Myxococcota bacterium]|nr:site-2 protease family protein [Myxococcota bacterium]
MNDLLLGVIWYAVFIFSLTLHEAAHALFAMRGGDLTAYHSGQVSLDPTPHLRREPIGSIVVPLLSFAFSGWMIGWASTPYDPRWAFDHPKAAGRMSLAGPLANLILVIVAMLAIRTGIFLGVFHPPETIGFAAVVASSAGGVWLTVATLLSVMFTLNLLLFIFNLIPLPPLDGSGVLALLVSDDRARRLQILLSRPQFSMLGLLVAWFAVGPIFGPALRLAVNLLYPELTYG